MERPDLEMQPAPGQPVLRLEGDLTLAHGDTLRQVLLTAAEAGGEVRLDLGGATAIDLCGMQLLCSAHRHWRERGLRLELATPPAWLAEAARLAGFDRGTLGCPYGSPAEGPFRCLWRGA